jgi:hypothetical protein
MLSLVLPGGPSCRLARAWFVAVSGPLVPKLRRSKIAGGFLDGVSVASLVLMAVVTFQLGRAAIVDVTTATQRR